MAAGQRNSLSRNLDFSFVIGVASLSADVAITTKSMRRLNLIHCVVSVFFNATILALTINIAASFCSKISVPATFPQRADGNVGR